VLPAAPAVPPAQASPHLANPYPPISAPGVVPPAAMGQQPTHAGGVATPSHTGGGSSGGGADTAARAAGRTGRSPFATQGLQDSVSDAFPAWMLAAASGGPPAGGGAAGGPAHGGGAAAPPPAGAGAGAGAAAAPAPPLLQPQAESIEMIPITTINTEDLPLLGAGLNSFNAIGSMGFGPDYALPSGGISSLLGNILEGAGGASVGAGAAGVYHGGGAAGAMHAGSHTGAMGPPPLAAGAGAAAGPPVVERQLSLKLSGMSLDLAEELKG
jgi:hypothetical protein